MRFAHSRKMKNDENCISAMAETEKSLKTAFQPLGNGENASKQLSNPLEMEETPQDSFPTPWKQKDRC